MITYTNLFVYRLQIRGVSTILSYHAYTVPESKSALSFRVSQFSFKSVYISYLPYIVNTYYLRFEKVSSLFIVT